LRRLPVCLPCCLIFLSVEFLLVIVIVAGCVVLCSHAAGFAVCFWCSSASWFYFWWLRFGFRTLVYFFAIMVRLLVSASLSALYWCIASLLPSGCSWLLLGCFYCPAEFAAAVIMLLSLLLVSGAVLLVGSIFGGWVLASELLLVRLLFWLGCLPPLDGYWHAFLPVLCWCFAS